MTQAKCQVMVGVADTGSKYTLPTYNNALPTFCDKPAVGRLYVVEAEADPHYYDDITAIGWVYYCREHYDERVGKDGFYSKTPWTIKLVENPV